LSTNETIITIA